MGCIWPSSPPSEAGHDRQGAGNGADSLVGGPGADSIDAGAGNDTIVGAATDALLDGGADSDTLQIGANFDDASNAQIANIETVTLTATGLTLTLSDQVEGMTIQGFAGGSSTIIATSGVDTITGGVGNDSITGGGGADSMDGGQGSDTYYYAASSDFVSGSAVVDNINDTDGIADRVMIAGAITISADTAMTRAEGVEQIVAVADSGTARTHSITINDNTDLNDIRAINLSGSSNAGSTGSVTLTGVGIGVAVTGVSAGSNTLTGGGGVDTITGGSVADTITGGAGADVLDGGTGNDTYVFSTNSQFVSAGAVVDNINDAGGTDTALIVGNITIAATDDLSNAEGIDKIVSGTSAGAADATARTHSIAIDNNTSLNDMRTIDLSLSTNAGSTANVNLAGVSQQMTIIGVSTGSNTLTGGSLADTITGGSGSDTITGGAGADSLSGGSGDDTYVYTSNSELLSGSAVIDNINDTGGSDTVRIDGAISIASTDSFARAEGIETLMAGANGATHNIVISSDALLNDIRTIDLDGVTGSGTSIVTLTSVTAAMTVLGVSSGQNSITGGSGNDTLVGGSSNDTISGGLGVDSINAGAGDDIIVGSQNDAVLDGGSHTTKDVLQIGASFEDVSNAQIANIEEVTLTASGTVLSLGDQIEAFTINGSSGSDTITGGSGDDTIFGGNGADSIVGGSGADSLIGGGGNDTMIGGLGADVFIIDSGSDSITDFNGSGADADVLQVSAGASVTATLGSGASFIATASTSNDGTAQFGNANFIDLSLATGSNGFTVQGTNGSNTLTGSDESDTILGWQGADSIMGGLGADSLLGGDDNDTLVGGSGNDTLIGGNGTDSILGGDGADTIYGGIGADTIYGGLGDDVIDLGNASGEGDYILFASGGGFDTVTGFNGMGFDKIRFTDFVDRNSDSTKLKEVLGGANVSVDSDSELLAAKNATDTVSNLTAADIASYLGASFDMTNLANGAKLIFHVQGTSGKTYVGYYTNSGSDDTVATSDIELLGLFSATAAGGIDWDNYWLPWTGSTF